MLRLTLLLLIPSAVCAQAPGALTGMVQEAGTQAVVPFAVIEIPTRHLGVQADQEGHFSLPLPAALTLTDSLTISALGYHRRHVAVPNASPWQVELEPLPLMLGEVVVHSRPAKSITLGPTGRMTHFGGFSQTGLSAEKRTGWQVARLFETPTSGTLQAVRFYMRLGQSKCSPQLVQAPFRVRIYANDGPANTPGTDLLTKSVVVTANKTGWMTVDLSHFALPVPASGFFVAMEWLYTDARFLCQYSVKLPGNKKKFVSYYGQGLGGYLSADEKTTFYLTAGYPWQPIRTFSGQISEVGNAAIQAIIQP